MAEHGQGDHVVIVGGGVAGLEALMALADLAGDRVRLTLVAPEDEFELKALRPAEAFSVDHVRRYRLADLAKHFRADFRQTALVRVDADRRTVTLTDNREESYDKLVLTVGARPYAAYPRALTFGIEREGQQLSGLLADLEEHYSHSVAFVVPPGVSWPLPLYELALMTAREVRSMGIDDAKLTLITPERAPLVIFGEAASTAVAGLLDAAGIDFQGGADAAVDSAGHITLSPGGRTVVAERIVALPLLDGPRLDGVPCDEHGFIPTDEHGRVRGLDDVYAAGDGTDFPLKQGGVACQQADAVAEAIAAGAGAPLTPEPFRPVLRGKLLTGDGAQFLRNPIHGGAGAATASDLKLWFPPTKISGRYLMQELNYLDARRLARTQPAVAPPSPDTAHVDVDVELPTPQELRDQAMALDPYAPPPTRRPGPAAQPAANSRST